MPIDMSGEAGVVVPSASASGEAFGRKLELDSSVEPVTGVQNGGLGSSGSKPAVARMDVDPAGPVAGGANGDDMDSDRTDDDAADPRLPPLGPFPDLTFAKLEAAFNGKTAQPRKRRSRRKPAARENTTKRARTNKSTRQRRKRGPKVLPERSYEQAPLKLTNVTNDMDLNRWLVWIRNVWTEQKTERTNRLGPRDLGYNLPEVLPLSRPPVKVSSSLRSEPVFAAKREPKAVDDRVLKGWSSREVPAGTPGICGLSPAAIPPVLHAWGFVRAYQPAFGFHESLSPEKLTLAKFVEALRDQEGSNRMLFDCIFSALTSLALSAGFVNEDTENELVVPEGENPWMAVNNLTWTHRMLVLLRKLEEKRSARIKEALEDEAEAEDEAGRDSVSPQADGPESDGPASANGSAPTAEDGPAQTQAKEEDQEQVDPNDREMIYYGPEMAALEAGEVQGLDFSNKVRLLALLTDCIYKSCARFRKYLNKGVSNRARLLTNHRKENVCKKHARPKDVSAGVVDVMSSVIETVVKEKDPMDRVSALTFRSKLTVAMETTLMKLAADKVARQQRELRRMNRLFPMSPLTCMGKDRFLRRYYVFGTHDTKLASAIYVKDPRTHTWSTYDTRAGLGRLLRFLSSRGIRERALLKTLEAHTWKFPAEIRAEQEAAARRAEEERLAAERAKAAAEAMARAEEERKRAKAEALKAAAAAAAAQMDEDEDEDSENSDPVITVKKTRSQAKEEKLLNFVEPDVNGPLYNDPRERPYRVGLQKAKKELIASRILFQYDGAELPVCYVCQETLDEDEWHCPITHKTFSKSEYTRDEFAMHYEEALQDRDRYDDLNKVTAQLKILKALLLDIEAAIPTEAVALTKREIEKTRSRWIEKVKRSLSIGELRRCLQDLQTSLKGGWLRPWFDIAVWKGRLQICASEAEFAVLLFAFDRAMLYKAHLKAEVQRRLADEEYFPMGFLEAADANEVARMRDGDTDDSETDDGDSEPEAPRRRTTRAAYKQMITDRKTNPNSAIDSSMDLVVPEEQEPPLKPFRVNQLRKDRPVVFAVRSMAKKNRTRRWQKARL